MKYILALDIGIASVGWAVLDKESETVIEAGANIFPEASAADNQLRRDMRGAKRNNRRLKTRINDFIKLWEKNNLSIPQFKSTEIVGLKVRAITEEITLDELYLILYSYLKHRGISYLEDALDDTVSGSSAYANGLKLNAKELETHYPCEIQQERLNTIGKYRSLTIMAKFLISVMYLLLVHIERKFKEFLKSKRNIILSLQTNSAMDICLYLTGRESIMKVLEMKSQGQIMADLQQN